MDKFTIMIMSNDSHELLYKCLDNVKIFTDHPYDLVIVDDASAPAYKAEDLQKYTNEGELVIVRLPKRAGCCALRNVGMDMSKTEFVLWLDNDTLVEEGWYKPLLDKIKSDPKIGLVGQPKDGRMVRNPFLPLTQKECMIEFQFALDYNHLNNECDFIVSYCVMVRKEAYRPIYSYGLPTPTVDPELGIGVKSNGYKVVVLDQNLPIHHIGSATPRPLGRNYLYYLSRAFTKWFKFWEPQADKLFELYKPDIKVQYNHDAQEPGRDQSKGSHGDFDKDFEEIPEQYRYREF